MATSCNAEKTLIVLSAPSIQDPYYASNFDQIIDFLAYYANQIIGKDDVIILVGSDTLPSFKGKVPSNILVEANIFDLWIRDYSPVIPAKQVKFKYLPAHSPANEAKEIDDSFLNWFTENKLEYQTKSDIVLDGGNVVDNAAGTRVIITTHILSDNPSLTKSEAMAIIPEPPDDTNGHSDGSVTWPTDDKILILKRPEPIH